MSTDIKSLGSFVWSIAELLRGDFKQSEYGKVILPFVVLRCLDCILEATKQDVLDMATSLPDDMDDEARDTLLSGAVGQDIRIYNLSRFTDWATLESMRVAMPKINRDTLGGFRLRVPSLDAQDRYIASFAVKRARFETVADKITASIESLKEYRSALITAAVTGQIDVQTYTKSGTPDRRLDTIQEEMGA
jgi:type I restriction-modification system DNA methylase subunit